MVLCDFLLPPPSLLLPLLVLAVPSWRKPFPSEANWKEPRFVTGEPVGGRAGEEVLAIVLGDREEHSPICLLLALEPTSRGGL